MASEIRVNSINNRSGLGTITVADTGIVVAGLVTANTFSGNVSSVDLTTQSINVSAGGTIYGNLGVGTTNPTSKLTVSGNVLISGIATVASIVESSSITLKENINPIQNALEKVLQLNPVTYDRKNNLSKDEAGLIAEEVDKIIPNIVSKDGQGNPQGINYTKLTAYLVGAVKTLAKELEDLKNGRI